MSLWSVKFLEWLIKNLHVWFRRQKRLLTFRVFLKRFELLESVFGNGDGWRCNRHVLNDVSFFALLHPFEETLTESWIIMLLPLATHAFIIMKTIKKMMTLSLSFSERCKTRVCCFTLTLFDLAIIIGAFSYHKARDGQTTFGEGTEASYWQSFYLRWMPKYLCRVIKCLWHCAGNKKKTSESDQLSVPFRLSKTEIPKSLLFKLT